jgi:hypothetical protein
MRKIRSNMIFFYIKVNIDVTEIIKVTLRNVFLNVPFTECIDDVLFTECFDDVLMY